MGCSNSKDQGPQGTLMEQYQQAGLTHPWSTNYENDFEKQIFMAINLCRHDPKRFVPYVRMAYKNYPPLKQGKRQAELIKKLQTMEAIPLVRFDPQANEAVRGNNNAIYEANEETVKAGGNVAKYSELNGGTDMSAKCEEITISKFEGHEGTEFVAILLATDFEKDRSAEGKQEPAQPAGPQTE